MKYQNEEVNLFTKKKKKNKNTFNRSNLSQA